MKTIRFFISILFLLLVVAIIGNIVMSTIGLFFNHDVFNTGIYSNNEVSLNIKVIFIFKVIALLMFIFGVYVLISKLKFLVRRDFFNLILIIPAFPAAS